VNLGLCFGDDGGREFILLGLFVVTIMSNHIVNRIECRELRPGSLVLVMVPQSPFISP
jgi:hypothetical protein